MRGGSELARNLLEFRCEAFELALESAVIDSERVEVSTLMFIGFHKEIILLLQVNEVNLQRCDVRGSAG